METITKLSKLAEQVSIRINGNARMANAKMDEWQKGAQDYSLTLGYKGRKMTLNYFQGCGIKTDPTSRGVLDCLLSDASGADNARSFEEWASEYGYSNDSRKAEKVYRAVERQTIKLKSLLGADYDTFLEAERD